jgi:DNA-binding transcriptional MerR regulator
MAGLGARSYKSGQIEMTSEIHAGRVRPVDDAEISEASADEHFVRIGELAQEFAISLRTLRFYEDKGLLRPKRVGATRLFSRRDRARLKLIILGRKVGFTLREVKQILEMYRPDQGNQRQYVFFLEKAGKQMDRLKRQRDEVLDAMNDLQSLIHEVRGRLTDKAA